MTALPEDTVASLSSRRRPAATYHCRGPRPGLIAVTVAGEIDAANAAELIDVVADELPVARRLVLDLSAVSFFAVEGFSTLQRITVMCARAGVAWAVVPSAAVRRVLDVCSHGGSWVVADTADAAASALRRLRAV